MWKLFRLQKKAVKRREKVSSFIASAVVSLQLRLIRRLRYWDRRLSIRQKKAVLFFTCCLAGMYLSYVLAAALFQKKVTPLRDLEPASVSLPVQPPALDPGYQPRDSTRSGRL